jgi:hypothetical protein
MEEKKVTNKSQANYQDVLEAIKLLQDRHPEVHSMVIRNEFFPTVDQTKISAALNYLLGKKLIVRVGGNKRLGFRYKLADPGAPDQRNLPPSALLIEDVFSALMQICGEDESGKIVGAKELQERFFANHSPDYVRTLLNYLEATGKVAHKKGGHNNTEKLFYPITPAPIPEPDPAPAPPPFKPAAKPAAKKVLAFQCEVCQALVGLKAQDIAFTVDCMGCGTTYMAEKGWIYRLGPGVRVQVWTPIGVGA